MDISKKLKFYQSTKTKAPESAIPASLKVLQSHFNGEVVSEQAPYLKIVRAYPLDYPPSVQLNLLTKGILSTSIPLDKCLFFDLETTGLSGGTGTFPFLIGIGYFAESSFKVEQFFLPDFGREYYLFRYLDEILPQFDYLVSYNGKSFDLPLLKSRFILNRVQSDWERMMHIDLLHISRRIWKDSFENITLGSIEENLLNRQRPDDIPGALIPQAYFTYLRTGVVHDVIRIIEHNYLDIISMADLILILAKIEENPAELNDPSALIRLARLAYEQDSALYFDKVWDYFEGHHQAIPSQLLCWRSLKAKRENDWDRACTLWEELLNTQEYFYFAIEELAKYYEHKQNDFLTAQKYTQRGLKALKLVEELNPYHPDLSLMNALEKRMLRLSKKTKNINC